MGAVPIDDPLTLAVAAVVAVIGTARLTRLLTEDTWPPVAWLRERWFERTNGTGWEELFVCPFCMAPYLAVVTVAWGWASDLHWSWWLFYGWLSLAYLASMVVARDGGGE